MIVVDTNVLSELMKPAELRSLQVSDWFRRQPAEGMYTTAITVAEVFAGIAILPEGKRKKQMYEAADQVFTRVFATRIFSFDERSARVYPDLITDRRRTGASIDPFDMQIAAIAKVRRMAVATRNIPDFADSGIELIDPWTGRNVAAR